MSIPVVELKQLYEDRNEVAKELRRLGDLSNDPNHDWCADDQRQWDEANEDYNDISAKIQREERCREVERMLAARRETPRSDDNDSAHPYNMGPDRDSRSDDNSPFESGTYGRREKATVEDRCLALQAWARAQAGMELTDAHRVACRKAGLNPATREIEISLRRDPYANLQREFRAMSVGGANVGAETIPEGFVNNLETALLQFGGMRQAADIIRTATGNDLPWPTADDTSNTGALLAEETGIGASVDVTTGAVVFNAFKYSSKPVLVSTELLQDSAFNLANILGQLLGERIGRIQNTHFTTGDGASKPNGVVTASTLGVTAATATAITADEIIDLIHAVDPAYRSRPSAMFMMNDSTLAAVRKLKSESSQYLWQPGAQLGVPDRLFGYPIVVNQDMASIASTAVTVLFGDFSKYKIRDVAGIRMRRLVERYADTDQEAFIAFQRSDGDLLDAGTNPIKHLAQAL